ncbi:MAG: DNA internalization-related competence protein ComEC/Rec2 [Coriobacteriia bacterium]|nr:DNA internalization-related competence protein ComEC/Rec2 [Coriobacteriia bacterium]
MSDAPERPQLPPVAWFALAMCAGCIATEAVVWPSDVRAGRAVVAVAVAITAIIWLGRERVPRGVRAGALLLCAGFAAGSCVCVLQSAAWLRESHIVPDCGAREWTGVVEADPTAGEYGATARVRIRGGPLDGAVVRIGWPEGEEVPELGRTVRFSAILKALPLEESWARRTARAGVCATGNAWRAECGAWRTGPLGELFAWRATMLERMHQVPGAGADLAEGIVLGDRRRLIGTDTEEDFRVLGLTHLVAVSGSHLAAACAAVAFLGTMLRVPRRPLVAATMLAGAAYAVVTGLPYSALRSLLMLAVGGAGQMIGRRGDGIASLAVAVIVVLALEPWAVFDLGFQLSALAVCGLLVFGSLAQAWATSGFTGWRRVVGDALSLTLVAQFTTIPVVASAFGMVSLMAPVANVVVGPLVSVAMLVGLVGAVLGTVSPAAGTLGASGAASILGATAWIAGGMAQVPGAAVALGGGVLVGVGTCAGAVGLWAWWPLPRGRHSGTRFIAAAVCASVCVALGPAPAQRCTITVLDVGQGDAILVEDSGRTMLVDTGPDALSLRRALARCGIRRIDVLVLTHAHGDHTGGAPGLVGVADVGWIGVPGPATGEEAASAGSVRDPMPGSTSWKGPASPVRSLVAGDDWRLGGTSVSVQWPTADAPSDLDANDTSVVLQLTNGSFDMVLTGDAEQLVQEELIASGAAREVEVLKVPHHGSTNGLTSEGLEAWSPRDAIISVGRGNDFGHPCPETITLLESAGVRILRTDTSGDVTVTVRRSGYRTRVSRRGTAVVVRARMRKARTAMLVPGRSPSEGVSDGSGCGQVHRGSQERLPHLRRRGIVARARPPPVARPHRRGRRPRLQLRSVRRGVR